MAETVPVRDGLFAVGDDGAAALLGGRCRSCGRPHFPRLATCPYCSADDIAGARFTGPGTLWAWTAVTAAPPGYRGDVPFGFGVVELPDGLRVITRLTEADPSLLTFGQPMRLEIAALHADDDGRTVVTYAFAPEAGA